MGTMSWNACFSQVSKEEVGEGLPLIDLYLKFKFGSSKSEIRKLIQVRAAAARAPSTR